MTDIKEKFTKEGAGFNAYDTSTYGTEQPNFDNIMIGNVVPYDEEGNFIASYTGKVKHNNVLDPTDKNIAIGTDVCTPVNICVPTINVPDANKKLVDELFLDSEGNKITPEDKKVAEYVKNIADSIDSIPDATLPKHLIKFNLNPTEELKDLPSNTGRYGINLTPTDEVPLTDQQNTPRRKLSPDPITVYEKNQINSEEYKSVTEQLAYLLNKEDINETVKHLTVGDLTERTKDGQGIFDWLMTSIQNHLMNAKSLGLITGDAIKDIYIVGLQNTLQMSVQFAIEADKAYWANKATQAQTELVNQQKINLMMENHLLPAKAQSLYAQIETSLKQLDLMDIEKDASKQRLIQEVVQTDTMRTNLDLVEQQRKLAIEQLAQSSLDRARKAADVDLLRVQHEDATIKLDVSREQVRQATQQTKHAIAQTAQVVEQTRLTNTQVQGGLKDIKIKDAQIKQIQANLKIQAQTLLKEKEQIGLVKAQAAATHANVAALGEQIRVARAQYSDTIDGQVIGGILGAQMNVNKAQALAFERDTYLKFLNQIQSGWSTKKTADVATLSPNAYTAFGVDRAISYFSAKYLNMPNDTFKMPNNYRDYLSDAEMDGTEPTPDTGGGAKVGG